jgi:hypothetical protein
VVGSWCLIDKLTARFCARYSAALPLLQPLQQYFLHGMQHNTTRAAYSKPRSCYGLLTDYICAVDMPWLCH